MVKIRITDTESDGLADVATKVWCVSAIDYDSENDDAVLFTPDSINDALDFLHDCDVIVGHNWIEHDLVLLKKLYDWEPLPHQTVIDTLVFSRMLYPNRPLPAGYASNKTHSIEAWGYRVGRGKPDHDDWSKYTNAMGVRCKEDSIINRRVLWELEKEANEEMFYHETQPKRRAKGRVKGS